MVQLIIGRAGSGKTTRLLELVKTRAAQGRTGQIFLVPEQFSLNAERALCRKCGDFVSLSAEVLTFKSLATRVFDALGGGLAAMLDDGGKLLAMYLAVKNVEEHLKVYREAAPKPEFLKNLVALSDEFKSYKVSTDELMALSDGDSILSDKLNDISLICEAYDGLRIGDLRDPADRMGAMCKALDTGDFFRGRCVCIDGFNGFTGAELEVIRRMVRSADEVDIALCADGLTDKDHGLGPFSHVIKTIADLQKICEEADVECRTVTDQMDCRRFSAGASDLAQVESELFLYGKSDKNKDKAADHSVCLYSAPGVYEECEAAAAEIRRLMERGYRLRDIAVVTRDMAHYGPTLESVFTRYGIAAFSDRRNDVAQKLPVRLLVTALEIAANGCALNRMLRLAKTGLAGITMEEADELEAYALTWNVKGTVWLSEEGFTDNPDGYGVPMDEARTQRLAHLNELRRRIATPLNHLIRGCDGQTARKRAEALYRYTEDLGLADALERRAEELEADDPRAGADYRQLWEMICDCLDQFVLILDDKPLKNDEFFELFRLLITQYNVGVLPTGADTVSVGDAVRMRADHPRAVFVLGTADGVFPPAVSDGGILTQADRKALKKDYKIELAPSNEDLVAWEQLIAYQTFAAPSEYLWVSWPQELNGESAQPSYLVGRLTAILPHLKVIDGGTQCGENRTYARSTCEELAASTLRSGVPEACATAAKAALASLGTESGDVLARAEAAKNPRETNISPEAAAALSGSEPFLMPTAVEQFHRCRFSHFASHRLRVRARKKADFNAMEVGTFLHYVLEKTVGDVMAYGGFTGDRSALEQYIIGHAKQHIEDYIEENLGGRSRLTPRLRYALDRLTNSAIRILSVMIDEFAASSFIPVAFEKKLNENGPLEFDVGNGTVKLGGTVDRIDLWEYQGKKYIRVVDYKSGAKKFDLGEVDRGVSIQLLVYLFAVAAGDKSMEPAGMIYKPIGTKYVERKPGSSEVSAADNQRNQTRSMGLVLDDDTVIRAMEHVAEDQRERFIPVKIERGVIKRGSNSGSHLATKDQFAILRGHIAKLLRETRDALQEGSILCDPDKMTCEFCDYHSLCRFDPSSGNDRLTEDRKVNNKNFFTVHEEDAWKGAE